MAELSPAPPGPSHDDAEERWQGRPGLARTVRVAVLVGPLVISLLTTGAITRRLPAPADTWPRVGWWVALLLLASAVVWASDRALRRLLPLAALLELSVLFPGRAPTRFSVARQAGSTRQLEELVARPGVVDEPAVAAARILAMVGALRRHDRATRGHSERVRVLTDIVGEEMGLSQGDRDRLRWAALLHDIGKLSVSPQILNMARAPTSHEWDRLRGHPEAGEQIAQPLLPWLGPWGSVIVQHHERWDGKGYPRGLTAEQICLGARIVSVADTFEVMTAGRPYQKAMPRPAALRAMARLSGTQFDPAAVRALLSISAPRLRGAAGIWGWVSQLPILGTAPTLAGAVATVATTAAAGAGAVTLSGAVGLATLPVGASSDGAPRGHSTSEARPDAEGPGAVPRGGSTGGLLPGTSPGSAPKVTAGSASPGPGTPTTFTGTSDPLAGVEASASPSSASPGSTGSVATAAPGVGSRVPSPSASPTVVPLFPLPGTTGPSTGPGSLPPVVPPVIPLPATPPVPTQGPATSPKPAPSLPPKPVPSPPKLPLPPVPVPPVPSVGLPPIGP
jgi:HD-GYP domain-containing protein (c-di-GMP phosphodiesterase class II)